MNIGSVAKLVMQRPAKPFTLVRLQPEPPFRIDAPVTAYGR